MSQQLRRYYEFGAFRFYPDERILQYKRETVSLPGKAMDILYVLIDLRDHPGVDKSTLLTTVWGGNGGEVGNLYRAISTLKETLRKYDNQHEYIENIREYGYRFKQSVTEHFDGSPELTTEKPSKEQFVPEEGPGISNQVIAQPFQGVEKLPVTGGDKEERASRRPGSKPVIIWLAAICAVLIVVILLGLRRYLGASNNTLAKRYTENAEAYQFYSRGLTYWNRRNNKGLTTAIEYFRQAIQRDPNYVQAYVGLADALILLPTHSNIQPAEAYPQAKQAAEEAIRLCDKQPAPALAAEAHTSLAQVLEMWEWRWQDAEQEYRKAIRLNPDYATARHWFGYFLTRRAKFEEGLSELRKAQQLDPTSPIINADVAWGLLWSVQSAQVDEVIKRIRLDEAIMRLQEMIDLDPTFVRSHEYLANAYRLKGMDEEALEERKKMMALSGQDKAGIFGKEKSWEGMFQKQLDLELEEAKKGSPSTGTIAVLYARLGKKEKALQWLEKAFQAHAPEMGGLAGNPVWNELRSDPRFIDLMRRVGLTE